MDSIIFSRIAMAGWIFLAVLLGCLWSTNSAAWQTLLGFLRDKDSSAFGIAVLGALVGVGAPPALGFLLERFVTLFLISADRSMTVYPGVTKFKPRLAERGPEGGAANPTALEGASVFHVYFFSCAHADLLNWSRRRFAQVYASATGGLAVLSGFACGIIIARSFQWGFLVLCLVVVAVLFNDARLQSNAHKDTIEAWIKMPSLTKPPSNDKPT